MQYIHLSTVDMTESYWQDIRVVCIPPRGTNNNLTKLVIIRLDISDGDFFVDVEQNPAAYPIPSASNSVTSYILFLKTLHLQLHLQPGIKKNGRSQTHRNSRLWLNYTFSYGLYLSMALWKTKLTPSCLNQRFQEFYLLKFSKNMGVTGATCSGSRSEPKFFLGVSPRSNRLALTGNYSMIFWFSYTYSVSRI